jgi:hypothetical protein
VRLLNVVREAVGLPCPGACQRAEKATRQPALIRLQQPIMSARRLASKSPQAALHTSPHFVLSNISVFRFRTWNSSIKLIEIDRLYSCRHCHRHQRIRPLRCIPTLLAVRSVQAHLPTKRTRFTTFQPLLPSEPFANSRHPFTQPSLSEPDVLSPNRTFFL